MISQIYVSRSRIDPTDRPLIMDDIVTATIARNTMLGITGLLIASPDHFAQLIEGPVLDVLTLMSRIAVDPRHTACRIVRNFRVVKPSYSHYRIARFDCSNFGTDMIDPVLMAAHAGTDDRAIHRLEHLIEAIAAGSAPVRNLGFGR